MESNFGFSTPVDAENIKFMAAFSSKTSAPDLLHNCDLPPPLKVFPGPDRTAEICGLMGQEDEKGRTQIPEGQEDDKVGLLTALQLSQTRAREAEERSEGYAKERETVSNALFQESLRVSAYRNWVKLVEFQVSVLKSKLKQQQEQRLSPERDGGDGKDVLDCWIVSLVIPLGIAGIGFAFALRYLF